jgi:hypothetical protein
MSTYSPEEPHLSLNVRRLLRERRLQEEFHQLHRSGSRAVGMCTAELLDHVGAEPAALDFVLTWRRGFDPDVIRRLAGDDFPHRPIHPVRAA